jgi:hypothetical protein
MSLLRPESWEARAPRDASTWKVVPGGRSEVRLKPRHRSTIPAAFRGLERESAHLSVESWVSRIATRGFSGIQPHIERFVPRLKVRRPFAEAFLG